MKCNLTEIDIRQALENKKAFYHITNQQVNTQTLEYLDHTNSNFTDSSAGFMFDDINIKKNEEVKNKNAYDIGISIHNVAFNYGSQLLSAIKDKTINNLSSIIQNFQPVNVDTDLLYDKQSLDNILDLTKQQFLFAVEQQKQINSKTGLQDVPQIRLNQIVIDPRRNIGGKIDFLAILSDNTAIVRDYKTRIRHQDAYDINGKLISEQMFYKSDIERFKLEVADYNRILRESYGVKGINTSRVIPVSFLIKTEKKNKKITNLVSSNQDPLINDIVLFTEKTGFDSLDKFLLDIDSKIENLKSLSNRDIKTRERYLQRIEKLKSIKKEIITKRSINNIIDHVKHLSDQKIEELTLAELLEILDEFRMLQGLTEATYDLRRFKKNEDEDTSLMEATIGQILSILNDKITDIKREITSVRVEQLVNEATGLTTVDEFGNLIPLQPEGFFGKWFYRLSEFDNPYFKTLKSKLDNAAYEKRQALEKITEEVIDVENKVYEVLQQKGMLWKDFIKLMVNPETDNFYSKASPELLKTLKTLEGTQIYEYYEVPEWYDKVWRENQKKIQKDYEIKYSPEEMLSKMKAWDNYNNLELDSNGEAKYPMAWSIAKNEKGVLRLKESKIEKSQQYLEISKVPEFLAYYNMFEKYNKQFREMLGVEYKHLPNNFLPNIRKNFSERIEEWGVAGIKSSILDFAKDFSIREEDLSLDQTGDERQSIPKFYLNPFKDSNGDVLTGEKSYQLGRSLLLFAKMAYNFQEMSKIESEVLALREALVEQEELIVKHNGPVFNLLGNNVTVPIPKTGIDKIFNSFVDMYLYGINVKPVIGDKSGEAEKILLKAKQYFSLKTLGLNIIASAGSYVAAKTQAYITGKTGIYYDSDQYTESMKQSWKDRVNFLSLVAYFDPMNHRYGQIRLEEKVKGEIQIGDKSQRGWINQYVNSRLLMQPFALGDQHVEEVITYAMAQNYYVDPLGNLKKIKFPEQKEMYKDRLIINLFNDGKLNLPEEQVKRVYIQFRNAVQSAQAGIKGTISEEDKAVWQGHIVGQMLMNFKSWMPAVMNERFGKVKFNSNADTLYMGRYTAILQEFGTTKNNSYGTAVELKVFLKDIVLPKIGQLLAHLLSFHTIGGYFKGYKMKDDGTKYAMYEAWINKHPQYSEVTYEEFLDVQEKQLKSVIIELRILLTFTILAMLAMGDWDDDGQKDYRKYLLTRKLVSVLLKTKQELSFTFNPADFASMTKNPLPVIGLVIDAQKTLINTIDELFDPLLNGDITLGKDFTILGKKDKTDQKNIFSYSHTWIPGFQGAARFLDLFSDNTQYQ